MILRSIYVDKKKILILMHINVDKKPDYFFIKDIFQGVHNGSQGVLNNLFFSVLTCAECAPPWAEPPVCPW